MFGGTRGARPGPLVRPFAIPLVLVCAVHPGTAQVLGATIHTSADGLVRVVVADDLRVEPTDIANLIDAISSARVVRGLPHDLLADIQITVVPTNRLPAGLAARALPERIQILLAVDLLDDRSAERMHRVIAHEIAHIGLAVHSAHLDLPMWFDEGFSEWAAGPLTCRSEAKVRLDLSARRRQGVGAPSLDGPASPPRGPLGYAYYSLVFAFFDHSTDGALASGDILPSLPTGGVRAVLAAAGVHVDVDSLEASWQKWLLQRFGSVPQGFRCETPGRVPLVDPLLGR